eukprot:RCo034935
MLTMEDCLGVCDLSAETAAAIAEHEHVPMLVALEIGQCMMGDKAGRRHIAAIFFDDILTAEEHGNTRHAAELSIALDAFLCDHPEAVVKRGKRQIKRKK